MVADLNVDMQIVGVPIVRESDGLAMSSRNRYLDAVQREQAGALSAALLAGMYAAPAGVSLGARRGPRGARRGARPRRRLPGGAGPDAGAGARRGGRRMLLAARGWAPPGCSTTSPIDIGASAGIDGHPRVATDGNHELPWRN